LNESDTLYGLYPVVNYDSLKTQDQHQWSSVLGGVGVFYSSRSGSIKLIPRVNYWNFQNLGRFKDTTELSLTSRINYFGKRWKVAGNVSYTLQGAQNEWTEDFCFRYKVKGLVIDLKSEIHSKLPDYYQRYALGNNSLPIAGEWKKQFRSYNSLRVIKEKEKILWDVNASQILLRQNYFFLDSVWRNDTLTKLDFIELGATIGYHHKAFHIQLNYRFTSNSGITSIIPSHQIFSRIYIKGGVFKARKMISYAGMEGGYLSSYKSLSYLPQLGTISFFPTGQTLLNQTVLHFYSGFQIEEFKFFFRLENIQSFWTDKRKQPILGYPVAPFQIKLGITWDFFD
jgi:hypothetical protein